MRGRDEAGERSAADQLVLACGAIALGGLLLGLQRQADGSFCGTGYASLAMGALVALLPTVFALVGPGARPLFPRTWLAVLSAACGFAGLAFVASGVLLPGGPWMFVEALVLLLVLTRRGREGEVAGLRASHGTIVWLALMLLLRLWVTYRGVRSEWAAVSFDVPVLSSLPWIPDELARVSLGDFTAEEFGIPPQGLRFSHTVALWAGGLALCVGGLWWRHRASLEVENDRVHATIQRLPERLATLVELILPEGEWRELGLHGLGERQRRKLLVQLAKERVLRQLELDRAFRIDLPRLPPDAAPFEREMRGVLEGYAPPRLGERTAEWAPADRDEPDGSS